MFSLDVIDVYLCHIYIYIYECKKGVIGITFFKRYNNLQIIQICSVPGTIMV